MARGGVKVKLGRVGRADGDHARRGGWRALPQPKQDLIGVGHVAPAREHTQSTPSCEHISADVQRARAKRAQEKVVPPREEVGNGPIGRSLHQQSNGALRL